MASVSDRDPTSLHDLAVDAQTDITKLATGLAHAGASPQSVAQLTKMGQMLGEIVKILAAGPSLDQGQGQPPGAPPQGQPLQGAPVPQAAPAPAPQAQPAQPPQPGPQQHSLAAASHSLHAAMQQSAAQRRP